MPAPEPLGAQLVSAILDAKEVAWPARAEISDDEQEFLAALQLIADVADFHRDLQGPSPADGPADATDPGIRPAAWGHLRVLERIGRGSFGDVYRAWDTRLDREVALKLLPAVPPDEGGPAAIIHEGRLLARVRHPNVVAIYGAEQIGSRVGLWMEFVRGRTLEQALRDGRTFSEAEAIDIGIELSRAVAAVHDAGLLHRDVKAQNVAVADDGRVVLMDFGAGRELAEGRGSDLAGTPLYLAPEILAGQPATVRSDVYAVGVVLYHLLTGAYPVAGRSLADIRRRHDEGHRVSLFEAQPDVPREFGSIVERALARDPGARYATARELVSALTAVRDRRARRAQARVPSLAAMWGWATGLLVAVAAAAFFVFGYAYRPDDPIPPESRLEAVPLTSYPGREAEPAFSPDGSLVAFTWDGENQDNFDIYVKATDAEQPLRLTVDRARDGSPAWSPDGARIAFLRDKPGGGSDVRLIPPTGGPERTIGEVQGLAHQGLSWSPDGRSLAVVDRSSPGESLGIFVLDTGGGAKRRLPPPSSSLDILPAFSPDGRTIAFNRTLLPLGPWVHIVPVAGGEPRRLVPTSHPRGRLAWVPGREEILFSAVPLARDGGQPTPSAAGRANASVWRVPADGGQARLLAGSDNAVDVAVSADGRRLVYSQATMDLDIWRLALRRGPATGESQTRFVPSTKIDANPQFAPDGERVAFSSGRSGHGEIWVVDGQGRHPLRLTSLRGFAAAPRWSPDGKTIAFDFAADSGGSVDVDIYVISALGSPPRRVTTSSAIDATPSWSRDGRWIYFGSNRSGGWQVWKVPSSGEEAGNARQVTRGGGFAAIESTDGRHLYFARKMSGTIDPQNALWRIPVEGGDEEVVVEKYRSSHNSWDLTAEGLYFVDQEPSSSGTSWVVRFQGFDRRHPTEVARLRYPPFLGGPAVSVSSDGRWMLSTQSQGESDLMLVETFR